MRKVCGVFSAATTATLIIAGMLAVNGVQAQGAQNCQGIWTGTIVASSGSMANIEADLSQSGTAIEGTVRLTQGAAVQVGSVTGSAVGDASMSVNFGTLGTMSATINFVGDIASGTYSLTGSNNSLAGNGVVALTLEKGVVTANISGFYIGSDNITGQQMPYDTTALYFMQTGDSVFVSTFWNGFYIYNGTGTVIGNTLTFQLMQESWVVGAPKVMMGSASFSGGAITGIYFTGIGTSSQNSSSGGVNAGSFTAQEITL